MSEKEQNFFEYVYDLFYKFAQTKPEDVSLILSRKTQYPIIEFIPEPEMTIPLPRKQGETYIFEGMVFENSENGRNNLWQVQKSQVETRKNDLKNKPKSYPLDDVEAKIKNIKKEIIEKSGGDGHKENILSIADFLYKNRELLPKTILPYCEHHDYEQKLKFEINCPEFEPRGIFEIKIAKLDELWQLNEQAKAKLI